LGEGGGGQGVMAVRLCEYDMGFGMMKWGMEDKIRN